MTERTDIPPGVTVFERGWLSANNILFHGDGPTALVDSGYATHAQQTVALVQHALQARPLDLLLNTHLHSDHCGGNAALQQAFPRVETQIPPGLARAVTHWDTVALGYEPTGQLCSRFRAEGLLIPGSEVELGGHMWQVHGAPGHDRNSIVLFEPGRRLLISADALWFNGFGVVFDELEGQEAFDQVGQTLDLIESLAPRLVIPGHGKLFTEVGSALAVARRRLDGFMREPIKHANHAAKVLLKFKLLELQRIEKDNLLQWARATAYMRLMHQRWFPDTVFDAWIDQLAADLARSGAARRDGAWVINS